MGDQNQQDEEEKRRQAEQRQRQPTLNEDAPTLVGGDTYVMPNNGAGGGSGGTNFANHIFREFPFEGETVEGRYLLEAGFGKRGGQGTIYRCRIVDKDGQPVDETRFAIKILDDLRHLENPDSFGRFKEEAYHLFTFEHPHIIRCIDAGDWERGTITYPFFVMECIEDPLDWTQVQVPASLALEMGERIADALAYIHSMDRIHRDVKPANVLRSKSTGKTVLIDFGLGKVLRDASLQGGLRPQTIAGVMLGTANYMPYEQAADSKLANKWSDVYSLGATLYEWLTGQPPWAEKNDELFAIIRSIIEKERVPPPHKAKTPRARNIPKDVSEFVYLMMDPDYKKRPTANEVRHELAKFRGALQPGGTLEAEVYAPPVVVTDFDNFLRKVGNLVSIGDRDMALRVLRAGSAGHLHNLHYSGGDDALCAEYDRRVREMETEIVDGVERQGAFNVARREIQSAMVDSENLRRVFEGHLWESLMNGDSEVEDLERRVKKIQSAFDSEMFTPEVVKGDVYDSEKERMEVLLDGIDSRREELALGRYGTVMDGLSSVEPGVELLETSYDEGRADEIDDVLSKVEKLVTRINPEYLTEDEDVDELKGRVKAAREKLNTIRGVPAVAETAAEQPASIMPQEGGGETGALSDIRKGILLFAERKFGEAQSCFRGISGNESGAASLYLEAIELERRATSYPTDIGQTVIDLREAIDTYRTGGSTSRVLKAMSALGVETRVVRKVSDLMANYGASKLTGGLPDGADPTETGRQRSARVADELFMELESVFTTTSTRLAERNDVYTHLAGMYHKFAEEASSAGRKDLAAIYTAREGICRSQIMRV